MPTNTTLHPVITVSRLAAPIMAALMFMLVAGLLTVSTVNAEHLHVRDFGAVPNTGTDQAIAIQRAINAALTSPDSDSIPIVVLDAGEYIVTEITGRSPYNDRKVCLLIDGATDGFVFRGAVDAEGNPATSLIYNEPGPSYTVDYWMWVSRGKNVTIENIIIDFPGALASGKITRVADGKTWVELWPEVIKPREFLPGAEYVFLYDPETGELTSPKITLGGGWDEVMRDLAGPPIHRDKPWASLTEGHGFVIDTELGEVGMGLNYPIQWHHAPEKTFVANQVENLTLNNITLVSGFGHCFLPVGCKNITVTRFKFDPGARGSHRGWCARRDGLTMRACRGDLLVEDSFFQCTSDDMLAFWGFQYEITEIQSPTRIVLNSRQATGDYFHDFPLMIEPGDWIEYRKPLGQYDLPLSGVRSRIKSSNFVIYRDRKMPWQRHFAEVIEKEAYLVSYVVELEDPLPDFILEAEERIALLSSTFFDKATIRRVTTRNVTNHPGVLIPGAFEYLIEDCDFGTQVQISASTGSFTWHGGAGVWNGVFRNNVFRSSPAVPRTMGLRTSGVYSLEPRGTILIENNTFLDSAEITVSGSEPVLIRNNKFNTYERFYPIRIRGRIHPEVTIRDNELEIIRDPNSSSWPF